jgi:hypothetical protein
MPAKNNHADTTQIATRSTTSSTERAAQQQASTHFKHHSVQENSSKYVWMIAIVSVQEPASNRMAVCWAGGKS